MTGGAFTAERTINTDHKVQWVHRSLHADGCHAKSPDDIALLGITAYAELTGDHPKGCDIFLTMGKHRHVPVEIRYAAILFLKRQFAGDVGHAGRKHRQMKLGHGTVSPDERKKKTELPSPSHHPRILSIRPRSARRHPAFLWAALTQQTILRLHHSNHTRLRSGGLKSVSLAEQPDGVTSFALASAEQHAVITEQHSVAGRRPTTAATEQSPISGQPPVAKDPSRYDAPVPVTASGQPVATKDPTRYCGPIPVTLVHVWKSREQSAMTDIEHLQP
jgi:hypothetical protein